MTHEEAMTTLGAELRQARRKIERLKDALNMYANHKAGCKEKSTMDECTCGLDEVLK